MIMGLIAGGFRRIKTVLVAHVMSLSPWTMADITSAEGCTMIHEMLSDPDVLVFWLTTTLFTLFALFTSIAAGLPAAL